MKQPLAPKPLGDLLAKHRESLIDVMGQRQGPTVGGRYEHWDRLCRRDPPAGLNHEQWWLGIKFSRSNQYRQLPIRDTRDRPFVYMLPDQGPCIESTARRGAGSVPPNTWRIRRCATGSSSIL